jgi:ParB family chromosome partitioning protein
MTTASRNGFGIRAKNGKEDHKPLDALSRKRWSLPTIRVFVLSGLDAYLNEGGLLQKDLFQADHEGYLTDTAKLDRLVAEKLEALATEVRGEGWLWVEIQSGASYTDLSKFGRIHSVSAPISDEIRLEIEALQDEQERIEEKYPEAEEYPPDVDQRMAAIEARIDELNDQPDQPRTYREEEIPLAGAIVALENHGEAVVYRGLVRPEDRKKLAQAAKCETNGQHEPGDDNGDETGDEGTLRRAGRGPDCTPDGRSADDPRNSP